MTRSFSRILPTAALAVALLPSSARGDCGAKDPRDFGAVGDGCANDRNAIQAAADAAALACGGKGGYVALSPGHYRVNSMVHLPINVGMVGNSPIDTRIKVSTQTCPPHPGSFDYLTQTAVIHLDVHAFGTAVSTAPLSGFGIWFYQDDVVNPTSMIPYPPAIRADGRQYARFANIWITNAWDGISLLNNPGGSTFDNISMAAYRYGFNADGALDSMRFSRIHCAPNLDMTENQRTAHASASTCIRSGRIDDLHVSDSLFLNRTGIELYPSGPLPTFGSVTGTDFDFNAQLNVSAGTLSCSACTFTNSGVRPSVAITGGEVRIDGSWIFDMALSDQPTITVANGGSGLILSDTTVSRTGLTLGDNYVDRTLLKATSAGNVRVDNVVVRGLQSATVTPTRPFIHFSGQTRGSVHHSMMYDSAANPPGVFVQVDQDQWVSIIGNQFMNWRMLLPAASSFITARLNNGLAAGSSTQRDAVF